MKDKMVILLIVIGVVLTSTFVASIAYNSIGGKQEFANTFTSGCLNISLEDKSGAINLSKTKPISDVEGLETPGYTFTVTNNCHEDANYQINLETLLDPSQETTLQDQYVRVAIKSDSNDYLITDLSENTVLDTPSIEGAKKAYNLTSGTLKEDEIKTFTLKEWMDYDTTKEQGASKSFQSKISVIGGTNFQVKELREIQHTIKGANITGTVRGNITTAKYCITSLNECVPSNETNITEGGVTFQVNESDKKQIVCTSLDDEVICSEPGVTKLTDSEKTLAKLGLTPSDESACPTLDKDGNANITGISQPEDKLLCKAQDDYGITYYFRGMPDNNWVQIGDTYWRIVRINGDGTIRLIYNGNSTDILDTGIAESNVAYNTTRNDNAYVGFKYGATAQAKDSTTTLPYEKTHENINSSNIFTELNTWYEKSEISAQYKKLLDGNAGFCNDRLPYSFSEIRAGLTDKTQYGMGLEVTYYGAFYRTMIARKPSFKCPQSENDLFTTQGSTNGNQKLTNPVGLITADEVVYAGGLNSNNTSYWLYNRQNYWTMSPQYFNSSAFVFYVSNGGYLRFDYGFVDYTYGLRPVINLKSDISFESNDADGTIDKPFIVSS